ncbi:MAG: nuclear transport factor 2 family protein [Acidimicrobiia bacterium]
MYKAAVRALVHRCIDNLNRGDATLLLRLASADAELAFPGDNAWAAMYRPVVQGRHRHVTHRGVAECRAFAERFTDAQIHIAIEDVLVNGPPWNLRIAIRAHDFVVGPADGDLYNNRVVAILEMRWGRLVRWEDYEDTERLAAWDRRRAVQPEHL